MCLRRSDLVDVLGYYNPRDIRVCGVATTTSVSSRLCDPIKLGFVFLVTTTVQLRKRTLKAQATASAPPPLKAAMTRGLLQCFSLICWMNGDVPQ